jgi:NADH dehydrogenase FAD-containing subunit
LAANNEHAVMGKHLVLVGGGHAHLTVIRELAGIVRRGHRVTLVTPGAYQYYSGMGPGLLAGRYRPSEVRFHVARMVTNRGGCFEAARVVKIDPHAATLTLDSGREMSYDLASLNMGSVVPYEAPADTNVKHFPAKPVEHLLTARRMIESRPSQDPLRIVVAGGGPTGVEIAANARALAQRRHRGAEIILLSRRTLLPQFPAQVRRKVLRKLKSLAVTVKENQRLEAVVTRGARLAGGETIACDILFAAVGTRPPELLAASGLSVGPGGGLLVNAHLQSVSHANVFGGGDCIDFQIRPLPRVGVYAVRQNPILCHNLMAALEKRPLARFTPQTAYLLIMNMGDGTGIVSRGRWTFNGTLGFRLKHLIDDRFMRKFQLSGERQDRHDDR